MRQTITPISVAHIGIAQVCPRTIEPIFAVMILRPMIQRMNVRPLIIIEVRGFIVRKICVEVINVTVRIETRDATSSWALLVRKLCDFSN
jgi:hypothetical protein